MNIVYVIEDYSENGGVERIVSMKANIFYQEYHHQKCLSQQVAFGPPFQ